VASSVHGYTCYGLSLDSEFAMPDLGPEIAPAAHADVTIRSGIVGPPPSGATTLPLGLWRDVDAIGLDVPDVARYVVRAGCEVVVDPAPGVDPRTVRLFLLGTVMGALMMQRGHLVLHGNAFRVGDACAVVVGRSGAGKSTLAAEFQRRGYDVFSDDVVPVDADGLALPGYPRIKLWDDALARLGVDNSGLERVDDAIAKFHVPITRTCTDPLPLRWVYVLERHEGPDLQVSRVSGAETFGLLHEHTYRNELLHGDSVLREHLDQCARLAGSARINRVTRPADRMTVDQTADAILRDISDPEFGHDLTAQESA
jgi:hypothetical protein